MFKIKAFLKQLQYSKSSLGRTVYAGSVKIWLFVKFFLSPTYRSELITGFRYRNEIIQQSTATRINRYPRLFEIAASELEHIDEPRILSFGCSTGEEAISIYTRIPSARIIGVDINQRAIRIARKKAKRINLKFYHYRDKRWKAEGPYDCIFALAVFQKTIHRDQSQAEVLKSFYFDKFEQMIGELNDHLKPGGILVLDHADYSFQDLAISRQYSISKQDEPITRKRPILSGENKKEGPSPGYRVFIKDPPAAS